MSAAEAQQDGEKQCAPEQWPSAECENPAGRFPSQVTDDRTGELGKCDEGPQGERAIHDLDSTSRAARRFLR